MLSIKMNIIHKEFAFVVLQQKLQHRHHQLQFCSPAAPEPRPLCQTAVGRSDVQTTPGRRRCRQSDELRANLHRHSSCHL